jgi:hypothetical protein
LQIRIEVEVKRDDAREVLIRYVTQVSEHDCPGGYWAGIDAILDALNITDAPGPGTFLNGGDTELPDYAGRSLPMSIDEFEHKCRIHMLEEQSKPSPDNALINILCHALGLAREFVDLASKPIVPTDPPKVSGAQFFSYSPEIGLNLHKTLEAAKSDAQSEIEGYSDACDPEWSEDVERVCYGIVLSKATENVIREPGTNNEKDIGVSDYELPEPAQSELTEVRRIVGLWSKGNRLDASVAMHQIAAALGVAKGE